ncbi:MAG: hypothetical protein CL923_00330 [Deltaproteobacteria bacterium]|nr:hypothetical protein [Deltaproteobacteria bacterium]MDP7158035.1 hypothetical protein [SAR324 cluster bacterium]MDP7317189.1 hypothetical protein [SAR324 cluster bacterium]MDP7630048.1 hypothetical protein [SAR324 cluster bacterium]
MKHHTINRQNYTILKTESGTGQLLLHFMWGKFDFRLFLKPVKAFEAEAKPKHRFQRDGVYYQVAALQLQHRNQWYEYVKPSAHGLQLEETQWQLEGASHHAEFPKNLLAAACQLAEQELGLESMQPIAA